MKQFSFKWLALFATSLLFVPACGGDDDDGPSVPKQLHVEASAEPAEGAAPLEVDFTATPQFVRGEGESMSMVDDDISDKEDLTLNYEWSFGDDSEASEEQNPTHTYNAPGAYSAEVTVTEELGEDAGENAEAPTASAEVPINVDAPDYSVSVSASASEVQTGESVTFTCNIEDTDIDVSNFDFEWTFDEAGLSSTQKETTKSFDETGQHEVTCMASLGDRTRSASTDVDVMENPSPSITAINTSTSTGPAPLEVTFTPSVNYGGDKENLEYEWDFGTGDTSEERAPTYEFQNPNDYTVTLTVVDPDDERATATVEISVADDEEVTAAITQPTLPQTGVEPFTVEFDAQGNGNGNLSYSWDFGDGDTSSLKSPTHQFEYQEDAGTGVHTVELTVTDETGESATDTIEITAEQDKVIDTVNVTATNTGDNDLAPKTVDFTCEATGGNKPLTYRWDFKSNGTVDKELEGQNTTTNTYTDATQSPYTAECEVVDANGDTATGTSSDITVIEDTPVTFGDPNITATPQSTSIPSTGGSVDVTFSANLSESGNGDLTYNWTFPSGASMQSSTDASPTVTFTSPGRKDVEVEVTDEFGETNTGTRSYQIGEDNALPVPDLTASQDCGLPDYETDHPSNNTDYSGTSITLDASGSTDPDGDNNALTYSWIVDQKPGSEGWNNGNNSPSNASGSSFSFVPEATGTYKFRVEVTDEDDGKKISSTVTVESSVTHSITCNDNCGLSGKIDSSLSDQTEFKVTNSCGAAMEGVRVNFKGSNFTPNFSAATTDADGLVATAGNLGSDVGDATLTAETVNNTDSSDTFEFTEDLLDSIDVTHTVEAGEVANVIIEKTPEIEVSSAGSGNGGEITFQAVDKNFNPIEDNDTAVQFDVSLLEDESGSTKAIQGTGTDHISEAGFLEDGSDQGHASYEVTIEEGEGSTTATVFSETVTTTRGSGNNYLYAKIDDNTVTDTGGAALPGASGAKDGAAMVDFADLDFNDEDDIVNANNLNGFTTTTANSNTYFEVGTPENGPADGSDSSVSPMIGTDLEEVYNESWASSDYAANQALEYGVHGDASGSHYPHDTFGVKEFDVEFRSWVDTPTNNVGGSVNTWASGTLVMDDDNDSGSANKAQTAITNNSHGISYSGHSLFHYSDDISSAGNTYDYGQNDTDQSDRDYECDLTGQSAEGGFCKVWDINDNKLSDIDFTDGFAGNSGGFTTANATGIETNDDGSNEFTTGDGNRYLEFVFRAEKDDRANTQPSGDGWFIDDIDVDALAEAAEIKITPTDDIEQIASGAAVTDGYNTGGDDFLDDGTSTAAEVGFEFQDNFGNAVGAGNEVQLVIRDTADTDDDAKFVGLAEDGSGDKIGTLVNITENEDEDAKQKLIAETNDNGKVRALVANKQDEDLVVAANKNGGGLSDVTQTLTDVFSTSCNFNVFGCAATWGNLAPESDAADDTEMRWYLNNDTGGVFAESDTLSWTKAWDNDSSENEDWESGGSTTYNGSYNTPNTTAGPDVSGSADGTLNAFSTGFDKGASAQADDYNPDFDSGNCHDVANGDLDGNDIVYQIKVNNTAAEGYAFRIVDNTQGTAGSEEVLTDNDGSSAGSESLAAFIVEDPNDIEGSCLTAAKDALEGVAGATNDLSIDSSSGNAQELVFEYSDLSSTSPVYLILDSTAQLGDNDTLDVEIFLNNTE